MRRFGVLAIVLGMTGLLVGSVLAATISGNAGNNVLRGTSKADKIYGYGGNDALFGLAGNDILYGGSGNDVLTGGAGNDKLYGGAGRDALLGGAGNDTLVGGAGVDTLKCGAGRDTVIADASDSVGADCEVVKGLSNGGSEPSPTPEPTPTPTPTATARDGTYVGMTSQNEKITFRVAAGGTQIWDGTVNTVNYSCQPPDIYSLDMPGWGFTGHGPINASGGFSISFEDDYDLGGGYTLHESWNFSGNITSGGTATGTLKDVLTYSFGLTCQAPNVTWTALLS